MCYPAGELLTSEADVLLVAVGAMATTCLEVAERLGDQGVGVTVVDPRWVKPVDEALVTTVGGLFPKKMLPLSSVCPAQRSGPPLALWAAVRSG